jgi:hypothetical protein
MRYLLIVFKDVLRYLTALPNPFDTYEVPYEKWNHVDFLWAIDAHTLVYPEIMKNMEKAKIKLENLAKSSSSFKNAGTYVAIVSNN